MGPVRSLTLGNGLVTALSYDQDYRLKNLDTAAGATVIQALVHNYQDSSQVDRDLVVEIKDNLAPARNQTFQYDQLGRLTRGTGVYGTIDYEYDAVGNRTKRTVNPGDVVHDYTYSTLNNRLATVIRPGATRAFTYDAAGNVTIDAVGGGQPTHTLGYDKTGRLRTATVGTVVTGYRLNALGERVVKDPNEAVANNEVRYHYDLDGRLLGETTTPATPVHKDYIWLGDLPIVVFPDTVATPGARRYLHADHLGSPQKATDSAQTLTWDLTAGPFGELEAVTGTLTLNLRLPGQYADAETSGGKTAYRYNYLRDYDASLGRYLQSDPIGLNGGLNTYAYVGGDPVNWIDPTGEGFAPCFFSRAATAGGMSLERPYVCPGEGASSPGIVLVQGKPGRGPGVGLPPGWRQEGGTPPVYSVGSPSVVNRGVAAAQKMFPHFAGKIERHHPWPKYMGFDPKGPTVALDRAYHQAITNEIRAKWPYGSFPPSATKARQILDAVYSKFSLP